MLLENVRNIANEMYYRDLESPDFKESHDLNSFDNVKEFFVHLHLYNAAAKEMMTKLEILDEEFKVRYDRNPIHNMEYRVKTRNSIISKLIKKGFPVNLDSMRHNLTDIAGIRVICSYINDIYHVADLLESQDDIRLLRWSDYIKEPKPNGYRSLHLVFDVPVFLSTGTENVAVEVQIRTIAMDFWASLEHEMKYKSKDNVALEIQDRLKATAELISEIDHEMQDIQVDIKKNTISIADKFLGEHSGLKVKKIT